MAARREAGWGAMIRALLRLAEWLDKRFPPKVVVTQDDYRTLQDRAFKTAKGIEFMQRASADSLKALEDRVASCDKAIAGIKDALSRGGNAGMARETDRLRDQFIRGEFRDPEVKA